ncbi:MAG: erythromycin esterase family protein [Actinomycetota bacterium]|nr:erythromycin esterase family protein [Actinomycetota bacterium]
MSAVFRGTSSARSQDDDIEEIRSLATPLHTPSDIDRLLDRIGDARYVLLGEASHGTGDYYSWRAEVSKRLIAERGFSFVAVEGDWPDCFRVNRWVKGRSDQDRSAGEVLGEFERWPTWMWANEEVAEFAAWLHDHNRASGTDAGFYGLDVYSLWDSLHAVLGYLTASHPQALDSARKAFRCFEPFGEDPKRYAMATNLVPDSCEDDVIQLLVELRSNPPKLDADPEAEFDARQNAEVLAGAERYYRAMMRGGGESWNVRDVHMADTLDHIIGFHGSDSRAIVWEHNTHIGDARGTDMAARGLVNVGQLVRERHGDLGVVLVGFGGHRGSVIAADYWGAPMRRMEVPEAPPSSHEDLLHRALGAPSLLVFPEERGSPWLSASRGHRAIGVVYDPDQERLGNWVPTVMGRRYDAFLSFDLTEALHPIHFEAPQLDAEQETYPWST